MAVGARIGEEVVHRPREQDRIDRRLELRDPGPQVELDGGRLWLVGDPRLEPWGERLRLLAEVRETGARDLEQIPEQRVDGPELPVHIAETARGRALRRVGGEAGPRDLERRARAAGRGTQLGGDRPAQPRPAA